ncbi:alanine racemase, partial [Vibrio parahaemolyticus]
MKHNAKVLSAKTDAKCELIGVIKADAYGHGALEVCQAVDSIGTFAVARLSEGVALKSSGIKKNILVFSGVNTYDDLMQAIEHDLIIVVHSESQLNILRTLPT